MSTHEGWVGIGAGASRHVVVVRRRWHRTHYYLDGERVSRRHPFLHRIRSDPRQKMLGL